MKKNPAFRQELSPAFLEASCQKSAAGLLKTLTRITEEVRQDVLLPASKEIGNIQIEHKDSSDHPRSTAKTVTIKTDRDCETAMENKLKAAYPHAFLLSEEMFSDADDDKKKSLLEEALSTHKLVFLTDPLDGTRDFRGGGDGYGIMVAALRDGKIIAAVVHRVEDHADPHGHGHVLTFEEGDAVRINGKAIRQLSERKFPSDPRLLRGYAAFEFIEAMHKSEPTGDIPDLSGRFDSLSDLWTCSKMYADILTGQHHFMLRTPPADVFDYPAGIALIQNAGGVARFLDGTDATFEEVVKRQGFGKTGDAHHALENTLVFAVSEDVFKVVQQNVLGFAQKPASSLKAPPPAL